MNTSISHKNIEGYRERRRSRKIEFQVTVLFLPHLPYINLLTPCSERLEKFTVKKKMKSRFLKSFEFSDCLLFPHLPFNYYLI